MFITVTKSNWWEEGFTLGHGPEEAVHYGREDMMAAAAQGCGGEKLLTAAYIRVRRKGNAFSLFSSFKILSI